MKMGVNHDYIDFLDYFNWTPTANALYRASGVWAWGYSRTATYNDSTGELLTFIPNNVYSNSIFNTDVANGIDSTTGDPSPIGRYSIVFDDVNASTWTSNYAEGDNALHVWINANNNTSVGGDSSSGLENTGTALNWPVTVTNGQSGIEFEYDVPLATGQSIAFSTDSVNTYTIETGGFTRSFSLTSNFAGTSSSSATATATSTFTRTVSGTTVTVTYDITYPWVPNYEYGYNLNLNVCFKSATGNWGANDPVAGTPTITNFWIFTPGDSKTLADYPYFPNTNGNDRSDPLAPSQNLINWLTAPNGAGPATLRCCQSIAGYGACPNMQNYSDCVSPSQWNWSPPSPPPIPISYSRFYNTNPSNETYAWSSTKVYHPLLGGLGSYGGSDSTGAYIDLSLAGGELDYGYYTGNQHTLSGSASVESGSATVMMTASQTYWGGQVLIFPTQPTVRYFVAETTTGTSFALTTNYTGENASGLTVSSWVGGIVELVSTNPHGLRTGDSVSFGASSIGPSYIPITGGYGTTFSGASVTYGSEYVTFSEPVTIPTWPSGQYQTIVFSSDPTGQAYTIQVASSAKVAVTNGLDTITFASSVTLATGIQIWFAADDTGTAYTIQTGGTGTTFTLTSTYTGISSTSTTINFSRVLNATVAVSGNSEAITFSSSVTLSTGQQLSFSADSSNTVYTIASGGTGTTFALTSAYTGPNSAGTTAKLVQTGTVFHFNPYYLGTNSTSATATLCAAIDTWLATSPVVVTGPTTFLVQIGALYAMSDPPPVWQALQTFEMPMATTLLGTASVTNGSADFTFSQSQSLASGLSISFGSDTADTVYTLDGSVSGTSGVLDKPYVGATSETSTVYLPWLVTPNAKTGLAPYAFFANLAAQWEGCELWIPLPPHMSAACLQQIADDMAPYLLEGATVICEEGDENWNTSFPLYALTRLYGNLIQYVEVGTEISNYFESPGRTLDSTEAYCVTSSQKHDILQAQFDTWNKGINVGRCIGSQFGGSNFTTEIISFCKTGLGVTSPIPIGLIPVAPYVNPNWNSGSIDTTYQNWTTSSLGAANPTAINAWFRHYLKYSTEFAAAIAQQTTALEAYDGPTGYACQIGNLPGNYTYEGSIQQIINPDAATKQLNPLQHDVFYNPGFAGSWNAWAQALQDGGLDVTTYFTLGGAWGELWSAVIYQQQQPGDGSTNLYTSDQAGGDGYSHDYPNTSVALQQLRNWIAGANVPSGSSAATLSITEAYDGRDLAATAGSGAVSATIAISGASDRVDLRAGGALGITRVSPSKIQPNTSSAITLTLLGSGTSWTDESTATITNSVVGTTTVTAGTLTVISATMATLTVTTGSGTGTFTVSLGGATSPNCAVGSKPAGWHPQMSRHGRARRVAG